MRTAKHILFAVVACFSLGVVTISWAQNTPTAPARRDDGGGTGISEGLATQNQASAGSNDGIANGFRSGLKTMFAMPDYPYTEGLGSLQTGLTLKGDCQNLHDWRHGQYVYYAHNPCYNGWNNNQTGLMVVMKNDTTQSPSVPLRKCCLNNVWGLGVDTYITNRGWSAGSPPFGPGSWSKQSGINSVLNVWAMGISGGITQQVNKRAAGDLQTWSSITHFMGGAIAPADEGVAGTRIYQYQTDFAGLYRGTIKGFNGPGPTASGVSPVIFTATVSDNGNNVSPGHPMLDNAHIMEGMVTGGVVSGGGVTEAINVTSGVITPTEAWGAVTKDAIVDTDGDNGYKDVSISVGAAGGGSSGHWTPGHVVLLFGNGFTECSVISAVNGSTSVPVQGAATLKIPLKHSYNEGTFVSQGGSTCDFVEFAANTFNNLRYSFQVIEAPDATHLILTKMQTGSGEAGDIPRLGAVVMRHGCTVTDGVNRKTLQPDGLQWECETPAGGFALGASVQNDENASTAATLHYDLLHLNNPYTNYRTSSLAAAIVDTFDGMGQPNGAHLYHNTNPDRLYTHNTGAGPLAPSAVIKSAGQWSSLYTADHRPQLQFGRPGTEATCLICITDNPKAGNTESRYRIWNDRQVGQESWIAYVWGTNTIEFGDGPKVQMDNSAEVRGQTRGGLQVASLSLNPGDPCPKNYFGMVGPGYRLASIPTGISTCAPVQIANNENVVGYSDAVRWSGHYPNRVVGSAGMVSCASCAFDHLAYVGSYVGYEAGSMPGFGISLQDAKGAQSFPLIVGQSANSPYVDVTQGWMRFGPPSNHGNSTLWSNSRYPAMNASISYFGPSEMGVGDGTAQSRKGTWDMGVAKLSGAVSGEITVQAPAAPSSYALTLPPAQGVGSPLNDGHGHLNWPAANAVKIAAAGTVLGSNGKADCKTVCDATSGRITLTPDGTGIGGTGVFATITITNAYRNTNYTCLVTQNGYKGGANIGVAWEPTSESVITLSATGSGVDRNPQEVDYSCSPH